MDLQTENRLATLLLREAAELRRQAEQEGVLAYLKRPTVRARPNSRFLTATVLGVQQANKAVEVNELWQVRQKELELEERLNGRSRHGSDSSMGHRDNGGYSSGGTRSHRENSYSSGGTSKRQVLNDNIATTSSSKRPFENYSSREEEIVMEGLKDEEIEEFLHSRAKRGRGAVGSRMDETGPYLPSCSNSQEKFSMGLDVKQFRAYGPEKPPALKRCQSSSDEETDEDSRKDKKHRSRSSTKKHSRKHRHKEKSRDKKTKRKEKRSRHS